MLQERVSGAVLCTRDVGREEGRGKRSSQTLGGWGGPSEDMTFNRKQEWQEKASQQRTGLQHELAVCG